MTVKADPNTGTQPVNQMLTITLANGNSKEVPVTLLGVGGGEGGTYTLIDNLSNLSAGTYLMAGFRAKGEASVRFCYRTESCGRRLLWSLDR